MKSVFVISAPAYWASYLINNDASSLDEAELAQAKAWLEAVHKDVEGAPVDCESAGFGDFEGIDHELADYTFLGN